MQFGKIENYKITGTCMMQTADFPDEIPDGAVLFDYLINGTLYPATEYGGKIPSVTKSGVEWSDNLDAMRAAKLVEISSAYITERTTANKGITSATLGKIIDCRESDILNISNLVTLLEAQGVTSYFYRIKDNTDVDCTVDQIKAVLAELIAALLSMWTLKQSLIAQVNAAKTAEEISAISWAWAQN